MTVKHTEEEHRIKKLFVAHIHIQATAYIYMYLYTRRSEASNGVAWTNTKRKQANAFTSGVEAPLKLTNAYKTQKYQCLQIISLAKVAYSLYIWSTTKKGETKMQNEKEEEEEWREKLLWKNKKMKRGCGKWYWREKEWTETESFPTGLIHFVHSRTKPNHWYDFKVMKIIDFYGFSVSIIVHCSSTQVDALLTSLTERIFRPQLKPMLISFWYTFYTIMNMYVCVCGGRVYVQM